VVKGVFEVLEVRGVFRVYDRLPDLAQYFDPKDISVRVSSRVQHGLFEDHCKGPPNWSKVF